ncbi:MFS transporter [Streptococcus ovuberis]|uniref:MFS transporter n=1 Tax=Streptococcus ovuberis TaxID=1936207 RepID=A0A7X6MZH0_9STRE|nr:MFS transporter [Streptococcus ovuberis]NKZ20706.1 MFS transporter [Streptococcus ovuberis]
MNKTIFKLITSRAVNKIGNVVYDYGNTIWIASMGAIGQKFLGYYQLAEQVTSLLFNPFGGAVADRFKRRQILLVTDALCALLCFCVALISSDRLMLYALLLVNVILAISSAFASPANKSYIATVVAKEELVSYNATLEVVLKIISVSAPLLSFILAHLASLQLTLLIDGFSFALSFLLVWWIDAAEPEPKGSPDPGSVKRILLDIKEGVSFIVREREVFFLLLVASGVNAFIAGFNYLLPFTDQLYQRPGTYASILSLGAVGAIIGALLAPKIPSNMETLLLSLALCGLSLVLFDLPVSSYLAQTANFFFEAFLTIFNIHFFSQVQIRVPNQYLGRVFSTIFTLAILLMPVGTLTMTLLPYSVALSSFLYLGLGIAGFALLSLLYSKKYLSKV